MAEPGGGTPLREAARDLALVEAHLRAMAVIVGAAMVALGDAMAAESRRLKRERKAARERARKGA